jgi:transcriptional regulator with XRE-family HTH domain
MEAQALVGWNLQRIRVRHRLSQPAVAVDAGTYVSGLERQLENATVAVLEGLANALDADVGSLSRTAGRNAASAPSGRTPTAPATTED